MSELENYMVVYSDNLGVSIFYTMADDAEEAYDNFVFEMGDDYNNIIEIKHV